jgi:hypothetical protein
MKFRRVLGLAAPALSLPVLVGGKRYLIALIFPEQI